MKVDNRLTEISHDSDRLHVTLCMFRLESDADKTKCTKILKSLEPLLPCIVPLNAFTLDVKYVDHFNRRVVYAGVYPSVELVKLAEIAQTTLRNGGIHLCGNFDQFTPHLTMMKLSRPFVKESGVSELNPFLFEKIQHKSFGKQRVESLRICETGPERGADNFYVTTAEAHNRFLNISDSLPSLVSRNLIGQMAKGMIDEHVGDSLLSEIISKDQQDVDLNGDSFEKGVAALEKLLNQCKWESPKVMVIMRGLPGSGKTHIAERLCQRKPSSVVCSADNYFQEKTPSAKNSYRFVGTDIDSAHKRCRDDVIAAIKDGVEVVIVDNTNTQRWEYRVYERLALLCGYKSYVFEITCPSVSTRQEFQRRCTHHVTEHVHEEMSMRWEHDPQSITWVPRNTGNVTLDWITKKRNRPIMYSALFLDQKSREILGAMHPPTLENVLMDHVTLMFQPNHEHLEDLPVGTPFRVQVSFYAGNSDAQVVSVLEVEERKLCTGACPHITIATGNNFQPKDVTSLFLTESCLAQPTQHSILTGIVGVKIAVNERESVVCTDPYYFKTHYMASTEQHVGTELKHDLKKEKVCLLLKLEFSCISYGDQTVAFVVFRGPQQSDILLLQSRLR